MSFTRKYLSADGLHKTVKHSVLREQFKVMNSEYTWQDCIMSGLAVFGFKFPSLLQFEKDKAAEPWIRRNLRTLYGVEKAPSDTCMRERLDIVSPRQLRRPFKKIFAYLQLGKALESYRYLNAHYIYQVMRAGRARWKIKNETFNTLKNQGYNFEHNYGHGYKNLCSVMTMLMMLAFLIDQVQQLCCKVYQQARKHIGTLRRLFEKIQNRIDIAAWDSWHHLLTFIGDPASRPPPIGSGYIIA